MKLDKTKITLYVGNTYKLKVKNLGSKKVKWGAKNKNIATINKNGKVTAKKAGNTTVTATVNKKILKSKVTVKKKVVKQSAYDKLYNAITKSKDVDANGNKCITYTDINYEFGDECQVYISYDKKLNQFEFVLFITEESDEDEFESTIVKTTIDRNGNKTIAVDCISDFNLASEEDEYFDMTTYLKVADYTENTELSFTVNDSNTNDLYYCKKQANIDVKLLFLYCIVNELSICVIDG